MPITSSFNGASARALGFTSSGYTAIGNGYWISKTTKSSQNVTCEPDSMFTDSSENTYYAGYSNTLPSGTEYSQNIVKYNSSGSIVWQRKLEISGSDDIAYSSAVDSSGNVYIVGYSFNSGAGTAYGTYVKYNSSGTIQFQKRLADLYTYVTIRAAILDSSGNLYICGETYNNTTDSYDAMVSKLDSSGAISWQRRLYAATTAQILLAITLDSSNNVYVSGRDGGSKGIVAKYNSSGTLQWQRVMTAGGTIYPYSVKSDSPGNVYVAYYYNDTAGGTIFGLLAKYNSSGTLQWQKKITYSAYGSTTTPTYMQSVAIDSSDNVYTISPSLTYVTSGSKILGSAALIQKFDSSGNELWARNLNLESSSQVQLGGGTINVVGNNLYISNIIYSSANQVLIAKLPSDGSKTGNYTVGNTNITYNTVSTTVTPGGLVDTSGSLTDTSGSMTSSTLSFTDSANDLTVTVRD